MTIIAKVRFVCNKKKINNGRRIRNTRLAKKNSFNFFVLYRKKGHNPINCIIITVITIKTVSLMTKR